MELIARHPGRTGLRAQLAQVCESIGDMKSALLLWTQLLDRHPNNSNLQSRATIALMRSGSPTAIINTWKGLLFKYPDNLYFFGEVLKAATTASDPSIAISAWNELSTEHPGISTFCARLAEAHENKGQHYDALGIWKKLVACDPSTEWQDALDASCKRVGGQSLAREIWKEMVDAHPTNPSLRARWNASATVGGQCETSGNEVESEQQGDGSKQAKDLLLEWYPGDDALGEAGPLVRPAKRSLSKRVHQSVKNVLGRNQSL
jgi:tetratricopeptide (TPR) repeat protein